MSLGTIRPPYGFWCAWLFARALCLYFCQDLFIFYSRKKRRKKKKKNNNSKWVCMWVLHAIVIICTGVPETYVARSPISKKASSPAALTRYRQPHPKRLYNFTSSPRPRSRSLTCGGGGTEGGEALGFLLPPDSSRHQWWKIFFCVCVHKLLVNPADRLQAGDEWEHWLLLHNTHKLTLKYIYIYVSEWGPLVCRIHSFLESQTSPRDVEFNSP